MSPAAINWGVLDRSKVVTLGREQKPTETEKLWRHRISPKRDLKHMGKHRNLPKQRSTFTWQHCRNLRQQGGSVRPSWATAFCVVQTALLLKITTKSENPEMVENARKLRKQAKQTNNGEEQRNQTLVKNK